MYVLKDLWEGNITPADRGYRKGSPYARLIHQANESEDEFYNHLSDAGKKRIKSIAINRHTLKM